MPTLSIRSRGQGLLIKGKQIMTTKPNAANDKLRHCWEFAVTQKSILLH